MIATTPPTETADAAVRAIYDADLETDGLVFDHTRAMAVNPEAYQAFEALLRTIVPSIGIRVYGAATLGAAHAMRSTHCLLAHTRKAMDAGIVDADGARALLDDDPAAALPAAEAAVFTYAARLSGDAGAMDDADTEALRAHGYSDRQIVDITLAASARNYLARALRALAVPVDPSSALDDGLRRRVLEVTGH